MGIINDIPVITCRIETQGSIGIEEQLTPEEIQEADVVILAIDVKISGENRFKGKPVVRMSTEKAMKNTGAMLQSIEEALTKKKNGDRKSTRLNSSHRVRSRMPSSA